MALQVLTAQDRRSSAYEKTSILLTGPYGVGKTSQLLTLPAEKTLVVDIEEGMKSVDAWKYEGASIPIASFPDFQDLAVLIAGPDPAASASQFYGAQHYAHVKKLYAGTVVEEYAKLPIVFVDSITLLSRLAMKYAQQQPEAFSEKTGKADTRGAYGLLGREVVNALWHLQKAKGKTVILSCRLEKVTDDYGRESWVPQIEGSKIGRELPGIVDQVITMHYFSKLEDGSYVLDEKAEERRFVCPSANPYALPGKDRSRRLGVTEAPDLGALLTKINHVH